MWYKFSLYPYYLKKEAAMKQTHSNSRRSVYFEGLRDGFPIGLGYFAVSFSLGIAARNAGLTVAQGLLSSLLCNAWASTPSSRSSAAALPVWRSLLQRSSSTRGISL